MSEVKPNYVSELEEQDENTVYLPSQYVNKGYTDTFYEEKEESGVGSFLVGALIGGVVGAATALFLAPKTGKEMRDEFSTQAIQIKDKSIELSAIAKDKAQEYGTVAKDKATEFADIAKGKTDDLTKTIQKQSAIVADKVKSVTSDGKEAVQEGLDALEEKESEFIEVAKDKLDQLDEKTTPVAEALKEAVEEVSTEQQ